MPALHRAHADHAVVVEHEDAGRDLLRLDLLHRNMDVGADAVAQLGVGIGQLDFDAEGARGRGRRDRRRSGPCPATVSPVTSLALAGSPILIWPTSCSDTVPTARNGSGAIDHLALVAGAHVVADIDIAVVDDAVERRADVRVGELRCPWCCAPACAACIARLPTARAASWSGNLASQDRACDIVLLGGLRDHRARSASTLAPRSLSFDLAEHIARFDRSPLSKWIALHHAVDFGADVDGMQRLGAAAHGQHGRVALAGVER